ncbi:DUF4194 domain-containing protein [Streptosporangium canum]|uniref:DUF4194 domain-containing protein n=1 Tax=Streptosporangium canum TaxID=324952 RepID=UPI00367AD9CC
MRDSTQPSFADIFDDTLFTVAAPAPAPLAAADLEEMFTATGDGRIGGHVDAGEHRPRFDGDTSRLPPEVCWTLQELVAAPHITEDKAKKHWSVLLQHEQQLRSRLSELGLVLEINREYGFAFTCQAEDPSPYSRTLLRTRPLNLAASALMLYLYNQYLLAPDDPVVETCDMVEHMLGYQPANNTDEAGFVKKIHTAIKALEDAWIIKPVVGTSRYLIYGVITAVLTAERVEALQERYGAIAAGTGAGALGRGDVHTTESDTESAGSGDSDDE